MSLRDRLQGGPLGVVDAAAVPPAMAAFQEIKMKLHGELVDELEVSKLEQMSPKVLRETLRTAIVDKMAGMDLPLNRIERERLVQELLDEVTGLGPLEPLLVDPEITDILVNGPDTVYIEREGKLSRAAIRFRDDDHLLHIINRIVSRIGRRIDETSPMVDARLPDGSRVNAIIPPLSIEGPAVSIRRFGVHTLTAVDLIAKGTMTEEMLDFLTAAVRAKLNMLISGGTGTGKTTLLNALSASIPQAERVITIEDAAELQLQREHVVRLETRPPNVEGRGGIFQRDLVRNSLRMRPDRIIVGEVRGAEVLDMLQAMNTGHEGSMTTVHANSPRDAINRLVSMAGMATANFSEHLMFQTVARAIDLIVHLNRFPDGRRRIVSVAEVTGMEGDVVALQEIFVFEREGVDREGNTLGRLRRTGIRPQCADKIARAVGDFQEWPS
jgi:pilus assembly protein CpaF